MHYGYETNLKFIHKYNRMLLEHFNIKESRPEMEAGELRVRKRAAYECKLIKALTVWQQIYRQSEFFATDQLV